MTPKMGPSGQKVSNTLLWKGRDKLLIAPERMKPPGHSRNDVHLWMCLVVKLKSEAIRTRVCRNLEN